MVLELGRIMELNIEKKRLVLEIRNEMEKWLLLNRLDEVYYIGNINVYVELVGLNEPLSEELIKNFEVEFGVVCDGIRECKVWERDGGSFVKYSYLFKEGRNIF